MTNVTLKDIGQSIPIKCSYLHRGTTLIHSILVLPLISSRSRESYNHCNTLIRVEGNKITIIVINHKLRT